MELASLAQLERCHRRHDQVMTELKTDPLRRAKLTKRVVDPCGRPADERIITWDTELSGSGIRIETSGRKPSSRVIVLAAGELGRSDKQQSAVTAR